MSEGSGALKPAPGRPANGRGSKPANGNRGGGRGGMDNRPLPPPPSPVQLLSPPPPPPDKIVVRALFDFEKINPDDLNFKKGDKLWVDKKGTAQTQNCDWWLATHAVTGKIGYIPSNYVCKDDNSIQTQDWWFDLKRQEADRKLLHASNEEGTFLLRPASDKRNFALSVRTHSVSGERCVKHYQIRLMEDGTRCYITDKRICASIFELIRHYSEVQDGLCTRLRAPCPRKHVFIPLEGAKVSRSWIAMAEKLGQGCFGEVYKGKLFRQPVAVKTLKTGTAMSPDAFLEEARVMTKLCHDKLVELIGVCTEGEPMLIITEFMVNGALLNYLRKDDGRHISFNVIIDMAAQIADGMHYLESQNFVHRDLRAANILVGEDDEVKVADFGLARPLGDDEDVYEAAENTKFPVKWTAPEAAFRREFSPKSDVWSFGVLLYELITLGRTPYPGMSGRDVLQEIQRGYRMPRPLGTTPPCSQPFYDVMVTCWRGRPEERPTFEHLQDTFENWEVASERQYDAQR